MTSGGALAVTDASKDMASAIVVNERPPA